MSDEKKATRPLQPLTREALNEVLKKFGPPLPEAITVSPDLLAKASEMFKAQMYVTAGGLVVENPFARIPFRVEVDPRLPAGRWKIGRALDAKKDGTS